MLVVSIVGALVIPRLANSTGAGRLDSQVQGAVSLCRKARALATSEGRTYLVVLEPLERRLVLARRRDPLAEPNNEANPEQELVEGSTRWSKPLPFEEGVDLVIVEQDEVELPLDGEEPLEVAFYAQGSADPVRLTFQGPGGDRLVVEVAGSTGLARIGEELQ